MKRTNRGARIMGSTGKVVALAATVVALAAGAGPAAAQCEGNLAKVAYLGISDIECDCTTNFSVHSRDGKALLKRTWTFRSEPTIGEVKPSGPSWNRLKAGDAITAVDGALITTREGSARFSSIEPGQVVKFTVRRDGRDLPVTVTVGEICPEDLTGVFSLGELVAPRAPSPPESPEPGTPRTPRTPRVRVAPRADATPAPSEVTPTPPVAPTPPVPQFRWMGRAVPRAEFGSPVFAPEALPKGWLGVGLNCQDCGGEVRDDAKQPVWFFGTLPTISFVDPEGPSARAGLRRGDQLTHIDGVPLVSEEGGKRFGAVKPGQVVRWRVIRDGKPTTIAVTAVKRPGDDLPELGDLREQLRALRDANRDMARTREMQDVMRQLRDLERLREPQRSAERRLRYAGSVAGSDVEVRGLGNVVVDDSGDEVVIITRDATIRIRPGDKTPRVEKRERK